MKEELQRAWASRHDPLIIDRKLDIAFLILWALYGGWGWAGAIVNTTILDIPITFYPTIWAAVIGFSSTAAALIVTASFFIRSDQYKERILHKRLEVAAVGLMVMFITVHPVNEIVGLAAGTPHRPDSAILALSYLVMPAFRILLQLERIQKIKAADKRYLDGEKSDPEEWTNNGGGEGR